MKQWRNEKEQDFSQISRFVCRAHLSLAVCPWKIIHLFCILHLFIFKNEWVTKFNCCLKFTLESKLKTVCDLF